MPALGRSLGVFFAPAAEALPQPSACSFIFVGAIFRDTNHPLFDKPILGIHRPFLSTEQLKSLTGEQAIATTTLVRETIEKYLKEMDVPTKYIDQMFSVPKDKVLWLSEDDFDSNFKGFVPSIRDWVDAKCDNLTDIEKALWESIGKKSAKDLTREENAIGDMLIKKKGLQATCEVKTRFELRKDAWQRWRKDTLQTIAGMCAVRKNKLPSELATALSVAKPNQQSAAVALNLAQTAALCRDYGLRENAIHALADRGDAKSQRILGNLYFFGGSTIAKNPVESMTWYSRAGAQGDLSAQRFYRDLFDKVSNPNHVSTSEEYREIGAWAIRNCPSLC